MNVLAHTSFIGTTGYNQHARAFFCALNKLCTVRVRNYTAQNPHWSWPSDKPHEGLDYLTEEHREMLHQQILDNSDGARSDFPIYNYSADFVPDVHIVLNETNHYIFYDHYEGYKIAYNVWETTLYPEHFFKRLLEFDELWVPSKWQRDCAIAQGYPAERVFIVPEGVDGAIFHPVEQTLSSKFQFLLAGRWDYRKSTKEIISTWLDVFRDNKDVELLLLADNPYPVDGLSSTEERLQKYKLQSDNINIVHFLSRQDYIAALQNTQVFLSCARSEGWNLPLEEAMSCGIPSLYSNWGGQLEFAEGKGIPIAISGLRPANAGWDSFNSGQPGDYCEPDFGNLLFFLKAVYDNHSLYKERALAESVQIRERFTWESAASIAYERIRNITPLQDTSSDLVIIPAYPDTDEKMDILIANINQCRSFGYRVMVTSHYRIPAEVQKLVDYYIYDSENWVVPMREFKKHGIHFKYWMQSADCSYRIFQSYPYHYSYQVWRLFRQGANYASMLGYTKLHYIDYDCIIGHRKFLYNQTNLLAHQQAVFYWFNEHKQSYYSVVFAMCTDLACKVFNKYRSLEEYMANPYNNSIVEDIVTRSVQDLRVLHTVYEKAKVWEYGNKIDICHQMDSPTLRSLDINKYISFNILHESENFNVLVIKELAGSASYKVYLNGNQSTYTSTPGESILIMCSKRNSYRLRIERGDEIILSKTYVLDENHYYNNYIESTKDVRAVPSIHVEPDEISVKCWFLLGGYVEILGEGDTEYKVEFFDQDKQEMVHEVLLRTNTFTRTARKWYTNYKVTITDMSLGIVVYEYCLDLRDKNVFVTLNSSSLGDSIAWFPAIEEFRKKHGCKMYCTTWKNELFVDHYPEITFIASGGRVENLHAQYNIGWEYNPDGNVRYEDNPANPKLFPLQQTSFDILGLPFKETKCLITVPKIKKRKQVSIAIHSTFQAKYWNNPTGWQDVTDYLLSKGYEVIIVSGEENGFPGVRPDKQHPMFVKNWFPKGAKHLSAGSLERVTGVIEQSELFIGIGSGLSWIAWCTSTPTIVISGFSGEYTEPATIRIGPPEGACRKCFNTHKFHSGNWAWCPISELESEQHRKYECSKLITSERVINAIEEVLEKNQ